MPSFPPPQLPLTALPCYPIGWVKTLHTERCRTPQQPRTEGFPTSTHAVLELHPYCNFEQALGDLAGMDFLWLIFRFHGNPSGHWKPMVLPPRGPRHKRGVFATRSPHRPNPIGLSLVRLVGLEHRKLYLAETDLLDGTPVLDLKPYHPAQEAFPRARSGWIDGLQALSVPQYRVHWSPVAVAQTQWLEAHDVDLTEVAERVLAHDPWPHPYRRIEASTDNTYVLAYKSWRLRFRIDPEALSVDILQVFSGQRPEHSNLAADNALHGLFHQHFAPTTEAP